MNKKIIIFLSVSAVFIPTHGMEWFQKVFSGSKIQEKIKPDPEQIAQAEIFLKLIQTIQPYEDRILKKTAVLALFENDIREEKLELCKIPRPGEKDDDKTRDRLLLAVENSNAKIKNLEQQKADAENDIIEAKKVIHDQAYNALQSIGINRTYALTINDTTKNEFLPLAFAGIFGCIELMKILIQNEAKCNSQVLDCLLEYGSKGKLNTFLKTAIGLLLDHGARPTKVYRPYMELLLERGIPCAFRITEATAWEYEIIYLLLKYAAVPMESIEQFIERAKLRPNSDLSLAVFKGKSEVEKIYKINEKLEKDRNLYEKTQEEALAFAAAYLRTDVLNFLLARGVQTNEATKVIKAILQSKPSKQAEYQKLLANLSLRNSILTNPAVKFALERKSDLPNHIRTQLVSTSQDALRIYLDKHNNSALTALAASKSDPANVNAQFNPTPLLHDLAKKEMTQLLTIAAKYDDSDTIKKHVATGSLIDSKEELSTTLIIAAQKGMKDVAEAILNDKVADEKLKLLNEKNCDGRTPLIMACMHLHEEMIRFLMSHGAQDDTFDATGYTALMHILSKECDGEELEKREYLALVILNNGEALIQSSSNNQTAFHLAAKNGFNRVVAKLLETGADPFLSDNSGMSAWLYAVAHGQVMVANTIHTWAVTNEQELRIKNNCTKENEPAIILACRLKKPEAMLQFFFEKGCYNVDSVGKNASNLLIVAANNAPALQLLLKKHNEFINITNIRGESALTVACAAGNVECAKLLLKYGAKANHTDGRGYSALMGAAYSGKIEIVNALIVSCNNGKKEYLSLINQYGASLLGSTPLMLAAGRGHLEIVKKLVELGADVTLRDANKHTALEVARLAGKNDVVSYLQKPSSNYSYLSTWF